MSEVLHIVFNEDVFGDNLGDKFSTRLDNVKLSYLQVKDIQQFQLLLSFLDRDLEIYVWVHINNSLKKDRDLEFTAQEDIAKFLARDGKVNFNLVTRVPNENAKQFAESLSVKLFKLGDMWDIVKESQPQKVGSIVESVPRQHGARSKYRFAIVSALFEDEYQSLSNFLEEIEDFKEEVNIKAYRIKNSEQVVLAAFQPQMGLVDASIIATYLAQRFQPEFIFMNGVCGGRAGKVQLRDLVIPETIFDYQTGKLEKGVFKPYLRACNIDVDFIKRSYTEIMAKMRVEMASPLKSDTGDFKVKFGSMACGSKVLKTDDEFNRQIVERDEKSIAVDMESYAFARAIELLNQKKNLAMKAVVVKAVMDFTDGDKNDAVKAIAAYLSSLFTVILIRDYLK